MTVWVLSSTELLVSGDPLSAVPTGRIHTTSGCCDALRPPGAALRLAGFHRIPLHLWVAAQAADPTA